ncbi:MAG: phospho-N-acetylmuramoyl-pentapeptide-transferase [candidate division NC10 bacterium]|nr:phospho-N-acetylmuramoyl-pentapeptide-transferase [candidate division NC10 bacterium]MBI4842327.1 phospho-N-acetylmuramoyl-pentapeptide-transferase [candidate division NC10 bacterium]
MLYHLLVPLAKTFGPFNVFRYVTFRTAGAFLTALVVAMILGRPIIQKLSTMRARQVIRDDGPQTHLKKAGTPTMGGVLILLAVASATLLWAQLTNRFIWLALLSMLAMGAVGFVDDYLKLKRATSTGLRPRQKFFWQVLIGLLVGGYLYLFPTDQFTTKLAIPFLKRWLPELGLWYIPFAMVVLVGCSNAVNLTDGLDGLAIVPTLMAAATFTLFAYVAGHATIARYLQVIFVKGSSELPIFAAALVGASLGFLWFNAHPAQVFMGDTGSLALGGALATVALVTKNELILVVAGGCFVVEALSVIVQVFWFRRTGRRIFRMAPIHHHYELNGLPEPKIIVRFWIVSFVLQVIALTTLKLR